MDRGNQPTDCVSKFRKSHSWNVTRESCFTKGAPFMSGVIPLPWIPHGVCGDKGEDISNSNILLHVIIMIHLVLSWEASKLPCFLPFRLLIFTKKKNIVHFGVMMCAQGVPLWKVNQCIVEKTVRLRCAFNGKFGSCRSDYLCMNVCLVCSSVPAPSPTSAPRPVPPPHPHPPSFPSRLQWMQVLVTPQQCMYFVFLFQTFNQLETAMTSEH